MRVSEMSFVEAFERLDTKGLIAASRGASAAAVEHSAHAARPHLGDFAHLISPAAAHQLEQLGQRAAELTRQRFGKVIRLFAPLYLSNECINNCRYCGFSRDNAIVRVTLSVEDVLREARALKEQGFRNLLLVAGEHPKFVSTGYLRQCVEALRQEVPGISLEVGPMETDSYRSLAQAGADGLVVYQETYDRAVYEEMHTAGPKRNFNWRLETPERAYAGGFRRLGIGALYGMSDWRCEAICLAAHADYLLRHCWKAQLTVSLPRMRPCAGEFNPPQPVSDRELLQLVCALRIFLPDAGIVLSTREPAHLRNGLIPLGITMVSAGSHTEPGGYTGAGREHLHFTKRGRIVPLTENASEWSPLESATGQFEIADERSPHEVAGVIAGLGFEPVWKDWDAAIITAD
jgi:2-iminoacetate synthase